MLWPAIMRGAQLGAAGWADWPLLERHVAPPSPFAGTALSAMHSCMGTLRCPDVLSAAGAGGTVRGTVRRVRAPASVLGPPGRRTCVTVRAEETARAVLRCVDALCALTLGGLPPQGNPGFSGERMSQAEMGEFGARDPTTTELDFGFQERVRGRARGVGKHAHCKLCLSPSWPHAWAAHATRCCTTPARSTSS